jgi:hypothetical protein
VVRADHCHCCLVKVSGRFHPKVLLLLGKVLPISKKHYAKTSNLALHISSKNLFQKGSITVQIFLPLFCYFQQIMSVNFSCRLILSSATFELYSRTFYHLVTVVIIDTAPKSQGGASLPRCVSEF